jgi:hypothetical protein
VTKIGDSSAWLRRYSNPAPTGNREGTDMSKGQVIKDQAAATRRETAARRADELHATAIKAADDARDAAKVEPDEVAVEHKFWKTLRGLIGL